MTDPQTPPVAPTTQAPPAATPPAPYDLDADIKKRLEYVIAGKEVTIRFKGTALTFKKWGLRMNLRMGAKVLKLVSDVQRAVPNQQDLSDVSVFVEVLSFLADDVLAIVAASISAPFATTDAAEKWLDANVEDIEEIFDLAYIVYEMNLKGDALGKLTSGMQGMTKKMASLSMSYSKS
jgi:hypothetical protein